MTTIIAHVAMYRFFPLKGISKEEGDSHLDATQDEDSAWAKRMSKALSLLLDPKSKALPENELSDASRDNAIRRWLQRLSLLGKPEYGLSKEERENWIRTLSETGKSSSRLELEPWMKLDLRCRAIHRALLRHDPKSPIEKAQEIVKHIDEGEKQPPSGNN
jgi:hypothetical protein